MTINQFLPAFTDNFKKRLSSTSFVFAFARTISYQALSTCLSISSKSFTSHFRAALLIDSMKSVFVIRSEPILARARSRTQSIINLKPSSSLSVSSWDAQDEICSVRLEMSEAEFFLIFPSLVINSLLHSSKPPSSPRALPMLPPESLEARRASSGDIPARSLRTPATRSSGKALNSTVWHLDLRVERRESGREVTRIITESGGGSSRVFRNALWALWFILSDSSTITTLNLPSNGLR